jgi:hypothetical protein
MKVLSCDIANCTKNSQIIPFGALPFAMSWKWIWKVHGTQCRNPTLRELWSCHSHSRKWDLESSRTSENLERDCRGQNTLHRGVLGTVGKVSKCRCPKWPCMSHLTIYSPSYSRKKGRESNWESNWQFDSRPLKAGNRPNSSACRWSMTHCWKALDESYNFGLDLVPIRVWGEELWASKVLRVQTGTISGLHFGSPGKKSHLDASLVESCREYYMGEGDGFLRVRAVVSQMSPS